MAVTPRRPVRVGGASGGFSDRVRAIASLAANEDVDVIVGDWLSEMTMTVHGSRKELKKRELGDKPLTFEEQVANASFAENFMDCFEPAIDDLARRGIKLAVNAGASDTELLAKLVQKAVKARGHSLKVAWIEGDEVTGSVKALLEKGESFASLMDEKTIQEWGLDPVCAQCYLGGLGIARALTEGADIVICGRVSDASPIIGAAAWWHQWRNDQFDELAGSLVIGHLLECSSYVCGGYSANFKSLLAAGKHINIGFPIAAIDHQGHAIMEKERNTGGEISVASVTSQLLYEIQGPLYYNCDVTADLSNIKFEQLGVDQVKISGVKGLPPPPTTKVGITAIAGFQAEYHVYLAGLDIEEKCKWTEDQVRYELGPELLKKFTHLKFQQTGTSVIDARNKQVATVDFRIFAQSRDRELLNMRNPNGFFRKSMCTFLQSAPGASLGNDFRQAEGKPYYEYHVALLPQSEVHQKVHLLWDAPKPVIEVPLAPEFKTYPRRQNSYETSSPVDLASFGPTTRLPLGRIVLGRSGDKASDCNVGLFARADDEWEWLRSLLTVEKIRELLGPEEDKGKPIDRFEMPHIRAVHFLLHDYLEGTYDSSRDYDCLGKQTCEYLRAKTVDIPVNHGTAWGLFDSPDGTKDELGTLNLLTPPIVAQAGREIQTGRSVSLNWGLEKLAETIAGRTPLKHTIIDWRKEGKSEGYIFDDEITVNTQSGSQWDGLRHWAHSKTGFFYNGLHADDMLASGTRLGIDKWNTRGGIVGRGVLIDYARHAAKHGIDYTPISAHGITLSDIQAIAKDCGITFQPGDILLVRTGFVAWCDTHTATERIAANRDGKTWAGVRGNEETLSWLWDSRIAAVAGDNMGFEAWPPEGGWCMHDYLLTGWGMPMGEMWDLEGLSRMCEEHGRWTFLVTSSPLNTKGGVASPPNALAVF
ncbi:DUF1446-domain-containing protein [Trichodelitschia bisporula]|uniref:DUF1446-domain-containing protein n=1 Tax=Trichodelitschia bisporula TaxID=703511 RepID=A0A6G1HYB2_9PEZI|nr:DUF1446-domain-containing protein [Trichodelitschia bisporula]